MNPYVSFKLGAGTASEEVFNIYIDDWGSAEDFWEAWPNLRDAVVVSTDEDLTDEIAADTPQACDFVHAYFEIMTLVDDVPAEAALGYWRNVGNFDRCAEAYRGRYEDVEDVAREWVEECVGSPLGIPPLVERHIDYSSLAAEFLQYDYFIVASKTGGIFVFRNI